MKKKRTAGGCKAGHLLTATAEVWTSAHEAVKALPVVAVIIATGTEFVHVAVPLITFLAVLIVTISKAIRWIHLIVRSQNDKRAVEEGPVQPSITNQATGSHATAISGGIYIEQLFVDLSIPAAPDKQSDNAQSDNALRNLLIAHGLAALVDGQVIAADVATKEGTSAPEQSRDVADDQYDEKSVEELSLIKRAIVASRKFEELR